MRLDPSQQGQLKTVEAPTTWTSEDGSHTGWKVTLPGGHRLATPAYADGRVFLGGGFGSYEFYALDADSGKLVWQYQTQDDGPTAAVVADGYVAFNTESCELEVLTVEGKPAWKHWLGDPLMSMPAIGDGRIFQVYPNSRGDRRHYLGCFDLPSGEKHWQQTIPGEVITSPVLDSGLVHLACLNGSLACFEQETGKQLWIEERKATSSPLVRNGTRYYSTRFEEEVPFDEDIWEIQQMEQLAASANQANAEPATLEATKTKADYLDLRKRRAGSSYYASSEQADADVGFAHAKGDAKMSQAEHLGHGHVSSLWAYQGSRPFEWGGRLYSSMGDSILCLDPADSSVVWKQRLLDSDGEILDNVLTPPALVNGKVFTASMKGEVCCMDAKTGAVTWRTSVGEPVLFQPAIARGRVYVPTAQGNLFAIETGDEADDGWHMWGATAAHNG